LAKRLFLLVAHQRVLTTNEQTSEDVESFPHVIHFVFATDDTVQHHTAYTLEQQLKTRYEKPKWSGNVLLACHDTTTEFIIYNAYKNKKVTS
jgi:hypothetical protein